MAAFKAFLQWLNFISFHSDTDKFQLFLATQPHPAYSYCFFTMGSLTCQEKFAGDRKGWETLGTFKMYGSLACQNSPRLDHERKDLEAATCLYNSGCLLLIPPKSVLYLFSSDRVCLKIDNTSYNFIFHPSLYFQISTTTLAF